VLWEARPFTWRERFGRLNLDGCAGFHFPHYNLPLRLWPSQSIIMVHDLTQWRLPYRNYRPGYQYDMQRLKAAVRRAAAVVCPSECTRRDVEDFLPAAAGKVRVIPGAPAPGLLTQRQRERTEVRKRYELPQRYALYYGTCAPNKNLPLLVETWCRWRSGRRGSGGEWGLVLVAPPGPEREALRRSTGKIAGGETVRFVERLSTPELACVIQEAAFGILPSLYEGFGLTLVEMQRLGVPVLCSHAGSLPEVGGDGARYFDPCKPEDLLHGIEQLAGDEALCEDLRERGLRNAGRYSWRESAEQHLEMYRVVFT